MKNLEPYFKQKTSMADSLGVLQIWQFEFFLMIKKTPYVWILKGDTSDGYVLGMLFVPSYGGFPHMDSLAA